MYLVIIMRALPTHNTSGFYQKLKYATRITVHENSQFLFPRESEMLIGTSRWKSVTGLLSLVVVLCGYQI